MRILTKNRKSKIENAVCKAAHASLRFGINGQVGVCCHNHVDIVGNIKDSKIEDIWNGEKIKKLRKTLLKAYSPHCTHCMAEDKIKSNAKSSSLYNRYPVSDDAPAILDFKIDNICNLKCTMCSHLSSNQFRQIGEKRENPYYNSIFFEDLKLWLPKIKEARFSGGEPFLTPLYFKIWDFFIEKNPHCKIQIQTNGTILSEKVKEILQKGVFGINISIDSFDKENYEKIREGSSFEAMLLNLDFFRNYTSQKSSFFGITTCAMKANRNELVEIAKEWSKLGANGWFSVVWNPAKEALWSLESDEFKLFYNKLYSDFELYKNNISTQNIEALKALMQVVEYMKQLNEIYNNPQKESYGYEFKRLVFSKIDKPQQNPNSANFEDLANLYFLKNNNSKFNIELFEKTSNFTSDEIFTDFIQNCDIDELSILLDTYKIPKK
ncbi:MAG: radical SAM protein [Bacteroidales bacterium]|jgi:MoaA/NifB/PqqE/SkfB family radical SAM enzyme|nr:radical SAM protein [Bacteroidales bacterium]